MGGCRPAGGVWVGWVGVGGVGGGRPAGGVWAGWGGGGGGGGGVGRGGGGGGGGGGCRPTSRVGSWRLWVCIN